MLSSVDADAWRYEDNESSSVGAPGAALTVAGVAALTVIASDGMSKAIHKTALRIRINLFILLSPFALAFKMFEIFAEIIIL